MKIKNSSIRNEFISKSRYSMYSAKFVKYVLSCILFVLASSGYALAQSGNPVQSPISPIRETTETEGVLQLIEASVEVESLTLSGDFTIESWVNFAEGKEITNEDGLVASSFNDINFHEGKLRLYDASYAVRGRDRVIANTDAIAGEWTHYAIVREGTNLSIYINGELDATGNDGARDFEITSIGTGLAGLNAGTGSNAQFEDFMIWDSARSQEQITNDMRGNVVADDSLLRYYIFNETLSHKVIDQAAVPMSETTLTGDFSVSAWVYLNEGEAVNNEDGIVASETQDINFFDGFVRLHSSTGGGDVVTARTKSLPGELKHYAFVRKDGVVRIYINGVLDATSGLVWNNDFTVNHYGTGIRGLNTGTGLGGAMANLNLYSYALDDKEITELADIKNFAPTSGDFILDGTAPGVEVDPVTLTDDFTIKAWVLMHEQIGAGNIDGLLAGNTQDISFRLRKPRIYDRPIRYVTTSQNGTLRLGEWVHLTFVRENGIVSIYDNAQFNAASGTVWTDDFSFDRVGTTTIGVSQGQGLNGMIAGLEYVKDSESLDDITNSFLGDVNSSLRDVTGNTAAMSLPAGASIISNENGYLAINGVPIAVDRITLNGDFTVESWVRFDQGEAIDRFDGLVASTAQDINFHDENIRLFDRNAGRDQLVAGYRSIDSTWTHYAVVREGGIISVYINGILDSRAVTSWNNHFIIDYIGAGSGGVLVGDGLSGDLDDFMIWDSARSVEQIVADMEGNVFATEELLLYYTFDGVGPYVQNLAGDGNLSIQEGFSIKVDTGSNLFDTRYGSVAESIFRGYDANGQGLDIADTALTDEFTLSTWVYLDPDHVYSLADQLVVGNIASVNFNNGYFTFSVDGRGDLVAANQPAELGVWTHFAITREDDGIIRLYINGVLNNSSAAGAGNRTVATPWTGTVILTEIARLNAVTDDFQIWNVARTAAEISRDLAGLLDVSQAGLIRYYDFDGTETAVIDTTGLGAAVPIPSGDFFTGFVAPFEVFSGSGLRDMQVASGMTLPTDLAFLPDGRMIVVEKSGLVNIFFDPTQVASERGTYLDLSSITDNDAERGLLAVEVDPEFESNGYVYLYHTVLNPDDTVQKAVVRYRHIEGVGGAKSTLDPSSRTIIWMETPINRSKAANVHHGGGLAIGYEPLNNVDPSPYKLYIVTSDESIQASSQDLSSDNGKVHRINLSDGSIPIDNPYYEAALAASYDPASDTSGAISSSGVLMTIHSYGVRNGWRASYDQESNSLFFGEVGSTKFEDVHVAVAGADYGWPSQEGFLADSDAPGNPVFNYTSRGGPGADGLNDTPLTANGSITGGLVYRGSDLPEELQDTYIYGDWNRNWIRYARMDFSGDRPELIEDKFLKNTNGRPLAFEQGPDGALYYIQTYQTEGVFSFEGTVSRLILDDSKQAPSGRGIIVAEESLFSVDTPHTVQFISHVVVAEGDELGYLWDFGDGNTSTEIHPTHTYTNVGNFEVFLSVTDSSGARTDYSSVNIVVGNAPVITITSPADGLTYRAGDSFTVNGYADDLEDGRIDNSTKLVWNSAYFTDGNQRPGPFEERVDTLGGITFTTPNFGNVEYFLNSFTVFATAIDSDGISSTKSVTLTLETSSINFDVPNQDVTLIVDGHNNEPGDFSFSGGVNFLFDLEAQEIYEEDGNIFIFSHWEDEVNNTNRFRRIAMPATETTIRPVYTISSKGEAVSIGSTTVFDFESDNLQGARVTSGSFGQIISDREFFITSPSTEYNNVGDFFLSTLEINTSIDARSDRQTGVITSEVFELTSPYVSLLVGGGSNSELVYFAIYEEDGTEIVRVSNSRNSEIMEHVEIFLDDFVGENVYWQVVDNATGGWGHITIDDLHFGSLPRQIGSTTVYDFEFGDLHGASITEGSFGQIISDREFFITSPSTEYNNVGDFFLSTLEINTSIDAHSDRQTGVITSEVFELTSPYVSLLVGGGSNSELVYFAIYEEDGTEIVRVSNSRNSEIMEHVEIFLDDFVGENVYWQVVDNATGGWGHITIDDLSFSRLPLETENSVIFNFEPGDLQGASIIEGAFGEDLITNRERFFSGGVHNKEGEYFLSTIETDGSGFDDSFTGIIRSPTFVLTSPDASVLIAGGVIRILPTLLSMRRMEQRSLVSVVQEILNHSKKLNSTCLPT